MMNSKRAAHLAIGLLWLASLFLLVLNALPHAVSRYHAGNTEVRILGIYTADGQPIAERSQFRAVGTRIAETLHHLLGVEMQQGTAQKVILELAVRNEASRPLDITACHWQLASQNRVYVRYRHPSRVLVPAGQEKILRLHLQLDQSHEHLMDELSQHPRVTVTGSVQLRHGFLLSSSTFKEAISVADL